MASHRKPGRSLFTGRARRAAAGVVGAAAASATVLAPAVLAPAGHADPRPGPEQVRAQVAELYRQAEQATQRYDGAQEQTEVLRRQVGALQDEVARRAAAMDATRERLGALAAEQYRDGGFPAGFRLALSDDPRQFLRRADLLDRAGDAERQALEEFGRQRLALDTGAAEARLRLADLDARQRELAAEKAAVQDRLDRAGDLLAGLTADQRGALDRASRDAFRPSPDPGAGDLAASGRAAEAIAFARAQLGKPYVWGATGPGAYDCSGLVQAAWAAAGVGLPRTTYDQIDAARRVQRDQLQPGDLVFFYAGISHVGLYAGGGRMIHAPHPGAPVRYESIDVMPFAGAVRPS